MEGDQLQLTRTAEFVVRYTHTSLGSEAGGAFLERFTEEHYSREMHLWQSAIEHYVSGRRIQHD